MSELQFVWWGRWPTFKKYQFPTDGPNKGCIYRWCLYFGLFEIRKFKR
jgi:hypothetical protein